MGLFASKSRNSLQRCAVQD